MRGIRERLSENLRSLRKSKTDEQNRPFSIGTLAKLSGVSAGTIQKIEAGTSWPDWKTLEAISAALGTTVDGLFEERSTPLSEAIRAINSALPSSVPFRIAAVETRSNSVNELKQNFDREFFESNIAPTVNQSSEIIAQAKEAGVSDNTQSKNSKNHLLPG